jgi:thioredoxin reductase
MKIRESSISSKIQKNLEIRVVIAGGDSALDWSIFLTDVASEVTLIHRSWCLDSVEYKN